MPDYPVRVIEGARVPTPGAAATIARGVTGLAKAVLGIDRAPADVVTARLAVCQAPCEHLTAGLLCGRCKCVLKAKARLSAERCPAGKW